MLEGLKAEELLTYWTDCQMVGFGETNPAITEPFYNDIVPARLSECRTQVGSRAYHRLLHRGRQAA